MEASAQVRDAGHPEPKSCLGSEEQLIGAVLYSLLLEPSAWIHRRVEKVEVLDESLVRRRVSVDLTLHSDLEAFSPPKAESIGMLPLTLLRKETLRNFDLRDAAGQPLPMLSRAENERLAAACLIVDAEGLLGAALPCELEASLRRVAGGEPEEARAEIQSWRRKAKRPTDPNREQWIALCDDESFRDQAEALAENFILTAAVDLELDRRLLYKFSYEEPFDEEDGFGFFKDVGVRLGWRRKGIKIETPGVAACASYHLEMPAPKDLEIDAAHLRLVATSEAQQPPPEDAFDDDRHRAHLYVADVGPGISATALIFLRRCRDSYLWAAFLTGLLITALLAGARPRLEEISRPAQSQTAGALLLVVPTILAAYIVRPGEHRLASRVLLGVRCFLILDAICALAGVALLAGAYQGATLHRAWGIVLAVSVAATLGLLSTLLLPRATKR